MGVLRALGFPTFWSAFWVSLAFAAGFMYNVLWGVVLPMVSVSVFTIITETTCVFVVLYSAIFLKHRVTWLQVVSIALCLAGVVLISVEGAGVSE